MGPADDGIELTAEEEAHFGGYLACLVADVAGRLDPSRLRALCDELEAQLPELARAHGHEQVLSAIEGAKRILNSSQQTGKCLRP